MKSRLREVMMAATAALVVFSPVGWQAAAQSTEAPRAWDGHPDLNGIWQAIGTAHWDLQDHPAGPGPLDIGAIGSVPPGQGVVDGGQRGNRPHPVAGGDVPLGVVHLRPVIPVLAGEVGLLLGGVAV